MNIIEFHQKIEQVWDEIEEQLEAQDCDVDCERQGSVFTITLGDRSQIVINKQESLLELWLASHNGGFHFAYKEGGRWVSNDGLDFWQALTEALAKHGEQVQFNQ
ncbi:iron donor protein CyaY [Aggregatibacter actinomycetemcomitans]|uniref:iron donor protein CyaY n=1 Tax=Aggregatibacter actinomycetemcomitans TaxID=714 RepID=UPI00215A5773|nr:iron donor protein CyaY [Aggregatibacter actinomycetemcomitans]